MAKLVFKKVEAPKIDTRDQFLHGTGITKKAGEKATHALAKAEIASLAEASKKDIAREALKTLENEASQSATILEVAKGVGITLDESQVNAIEIILKNKFSCLVGAAGTGKTTVTKVILEKLIATIKELVITDTNIKHDNKELRIYSFACISFTGRAVQQTKRALDEKYHPNCMTGHKCLGYAPVMEIREDKETGIPKEVKIFRPSYTAYNLLPYDLIIIDEASMFPVRLFNELIAALKPGARIVFIGDINQLPPVQDISVLPFAMLKYPTAELKTIHRQALDNPIIANAHRILKGEFPVKDNKAFYLQNIDDGIVTAAGQIIHYTKALHKKGVFDPMRDALIVQANKTVLGQLYLNSSLMTYFNPAKTDAEGVVLNRRIQIKAARKTLLLAVEDKVMALANDNELGITNGMVGVVINITKNGMFRNKHFSNEEMPINMDSVDLGDDFTLESEDEEEEIDEKDLSKEDKEKLKDDNQRQASHITTIAFASTDGNIEIKLATTGQYDKIAHAYAITCHKSQGGEYPHVIIAIHSNPALQRLLSREWLYTAVTRARERVFLFYNNNALAKALRTQAIKGSTIKEKADSFLKHMENPDKVKPALRENEIYN